jgi:nicotinamidase-related amidase
MDKFVLNSEDASLLIIDIQGKLVKPMKYGEQVIKNTNILLSAAEEMNMPVIVTEQYPKGLGNTVPELDKRLENARKFEKVEFTAYIDEVKKVLQDTGRKKVIISGMETHICVFQTARDLLNDGYQVFVVSDGVCSRSKENYLNGLSLMENMGALITNTETVIFDLLKKAGTKEFKALSKLIK